MVRPTRIEFPRAFYHIMRRRKTNDEKGFKKAKYIYASLTPYTSMAEMLTYANQLQSITSGRGPYSMESSHYEEVPGHISQKIIAERQKQKAKEH